MDRARPANAIYSGKIYWTLMRHAGDALTEICRLAAACPPAMTGDLARQGGL
jgi:hypothetical protein